MDKTKINEAPAQHLSDALAKLHNIRINYIVDNFLFDYSSNKLQIDFHADFNPVCDRDAEFPINDFKLWMRFNEEEFLKGFTIPDVDDLGEGEYRDTKTILWFEALENVKPWQIEKFLNEVLNK